MDENFYKKETDSLTGAILAPLIEDVLDGVVEKSVEKLSDDTRLVICGGAGSGKSGVSKSISQKLDIPCIDLDTLIPGGYTKDKKEYSQRLQKGLDKLRDELPQKGGWILEHVYAANPKVTRASSPTHALLLNPRKSQLKLVADIREMVSGSDGYGERALESSKEAVEDFLRLPGQVIAKGQDWVLKEL